MNDRHPTTRDRLDAVARLADRPLLDVHLVLDNVRSAFNVGSIVRTSEAARVARLHLCGITARPPHRQLARTALGATRHVHWTHHPETVDALSALRAEGRRVVALELTPGSRSYLEAPLDPPLALVVGHEVNGVDPAALALADEVVHLPMFGVKNSLNVAAATAAVLFEILRRHPPSSDGGARDCTS